MADPKHLELLKQGVDACDAWRKREPLVKPDLSGADLRGANLEKADLREADLSGANLTEADLSGANLTEANLTEANLSGADVREANLSGANLSRVDLTDSQLSRANFSRANLHKANLGGAFISEARLVGADLSEAYLGGANLDAADLREARLFGASLSEAHLFCTDLSGVNLSGVSLRWADLTEVNLHKANLTEADLSGANLTEANLSGANLSGAYLYSATLIKTDLTDANLTDCHVFGISAWRLKLSDGTKQQNLVITDEDESKITSDDIEVAQFLYLMLRNEKIRGIIDTITSKVVLILGRFTPERKTVLDALRDELRKPVRGYVPVVFDFDKPRSQTTVETVTLLARMARFVVADLTDAKSVLQELQAIVPTSPKLAVQPVIISSQDEPGMFDSIEIYRSVLKTHRYESLADLTANLDERVIRPAEAKVLELRPVEVLPS